MALTIVKGQKVDLTKNMPKPAKLSIFVGWIASPQIEIDSSSFLLTASGKVRGDADLVFYGNPSNNFMNYLENGSNERKMRISVSAIDTAIEKIAITLTIYEAEARKQNFGQVQGVYLKIFDDNTGQPILGFELGQAFTVETAIVIGELYRHNGEWKFNAVGAGYSGGLNSLCDAYGIEVSGGETSNNAAGSPPVQTQTPAPNPPKLTQSYNPPTPPAPAPSPPSQLNLSKIELKKKGDKINLQKKAGSLGEILVNLNWKQTTKKSFWGTNSSVDLDLACLYELKDGEKGVIQALGNSFGSLTRAPYISLDGDDRTGSVKTGENIRINGAKIKEFKRILIFTFIYEGVSRWSEADGVVTIKQNDGPDIIVRLDEHDNNQRMCCIALIENQNDETLSIERIVRFYSGHKEIDRAFNWGLNWVAGSK